MSLLKKVVLGSGVLGILGYGIKKFIDSQWEKSCEEQRILKEVAVREYKESENSKAWTEFLKGYGIKRELLHDCIGDCLPRFSESLHLNLSRNLEKASEALKKVQNAPKIALNEELILESSRGLNFPFVLQRSQKLEFLKELNEILRGKLEKLNEILSTKSDFSSFNEEEKEIYKSFAELGEKIKLCCDTQTLFFANLERADSLLRRVKNAPVKLNSWIFTATAIKPLDELNEILKAKIEKLEKLIIKNMNSNAETDLSADKTEQTLKKMLLALGRRDDDILDFNDLDEAEKAFIQSFVEFKEKLEPCFSPGVLSFFSILNNLEKTHRALEKVQGVKGEFKFYWGIYFRTTPMATIGSSCKIYITPQNFTPSQENDLKEFDEMLSKKLEKLKALLAEKTNFSDFNEEEQEFYQSFSEVEDRIKFLGLKNKAKSDDFSKA